MEKNLGARLSSGQTCTCESNFQCGGENSGWAVLRSSFFLRWRDIRLSLVYVACHVSQGSVSVAYREYLKQKNNCVQRTRISARMGVTAALRILAYSLASDAVNQYFSMSEITARVTVKRSSAAVVKKLGPTYLCNLMDADIEWMLKQLERRVTSGLLDSIDCCKCDWKNCSLMWLAQFKKKRRKPQGCWRLLLTAHCGSWRPSSACWGV